MVGAVVGVVAGVDEHPDARIDISSDYPFLVRIVSALAIIQNQASNRKVRGFFVPETAEIERKTLKIRDGST